jgi:hypothetical protein
VRCVPDKGKTISAGYIKRSRLVILYKASE